VHYIKCGVNSSLLT